MFEDRHAALTARSAVNAAWRGDVRALQNVEKRNSFDPARGGRPCGARWYGRGGEIFLYGYHDPLELLIYSCGHPALPRWIPHEWICKFFLNNIKNWLGCVTHNIYMAARRLSKYKKSQNTKLTKKK